MAPLAAIVFDFDGVILESADIKTAAFVELFRSHSPAARARIEAHHLANLGISRFVKFAWIYEHVLGAPLSAADSAALGARFSAIALDRVLAAPFVPGAREALTALASRYPLFVASGTPQDELDVIVDRRGLRTMFREVHGTPRDKRTILSDVLARHGLAPAELLFVGDGLSDHAAATSTGVAFLARDTHALHERWVALDVRRRADLVDLPVVVEAW